jgi:predicted transcriptional regulator
MAKAKRTKETIDLTTGEVVKTESWYHYKSKGVYWFKLDFSFIGFVNDLSIGDIGVFFRVCEMMTIENGFTSNKGSVEVISIATKLSAVSIKRSIAKLVAIGLMTRGERGMLYVNPNVISYGGGEHLIKTKERFKDVQLRNAPKAEVTK